MSRRGRIAVGLAGLALLAGALGWGGAGLPAFGHFAGRYGQVLAHSAGGDRHASNSVVVVAFDYRGFDTIVEEMILFAAAAGVTLLLRSRRDDEEHDAMERAAEQEEPRTSESLRWVGSALVGPIALLGLYILTHGALTPGGGFQGGVILMAAVLMVLLAGRYAIVARLRGERGLEIGEALGAGGFALIGVGGLIAGGSFLQDFLGKGTLGMVDSGGIILPSNVAVGLEVAGALLVVAAELADPRSLITKAERP